MSIIVCSNPYRILMGATVAKWLLGISRSKWECNNEMGVTGVNCEDDRWMELARVMSHDKMWY
jgi:hypothetical protein